MSRPGYLRLVLESGVALAVATLRVALERHGALDAEPSARPARPRGSAAAAEADGTIAEVAGAALQAERYLPLHLTCLSRALGLRVLLRRRGIETALRLGVRRRGDRLDAHAWLEHRGRVVADDETHCRGYRPLRPPLR